MEGRGAGFGGPRRDAGCRSQTGTDRSRHRRIRDSAGRRKRATNRGGSQVSGGWGEQRKRCPRALAMTKREIISESELLEGLRRRQPVFADEIPQAAVTVEEVD